MASIPNAPDNVVYLNLEGKIDADDVKAAVSAIETRLSRHDKIGIVTDMTGFAGMTFDGFLEDFRQELHYLNKWYRFPYLAMIVDEGIARTVAETAAPFLPQVTLRVFAPGEVDKAIAFAAQAGEGAG